MKRSRREFLQVAGVAVPSMALAQTSNLAGSMYAQELKPSDPGQQAKSCSNENVGEPPSELRAAYEAAYNRLKDRYSLEKVAKEKIEVKWEDLVGMASPLSKQVPIQPPFHYEMVFLHPDLSLTLGREAGALALGFAVGQRPQFPDMWEVTRELHKGYQPIITSRWSNGVFRLEQVAFGFLPRDTKVSTGREPQYVMVRMNVTNTSGTSQRTVLNVLVGRPGTLQGNTGGNLTSLSGLIYGASHHPFIASQNRWRSGPVGIEHRNDALFIGETAILTFKSSSKIKASFRQSSVQDSRNLSCSPDFGNCLQFDLTLAPGQTESLKFVVASSPFARQFVRKDYYEKKAAVDEYASMSAVTFSQALDRAESQWDEALDGGMTLETPEPRLNNIFKGVTLSGFSCISQSPDYDWLEAYQTPFLWEVLPWEQAFHLNAMNSVGLSKVTEKCLRFFTAQQVGIGEQSANHGPVEAKSLYGSYPGQASSDWMNFTGSTLWMLASYYQYTKDKEWLKKNSEGILAAWKWIQSERDRTRQKPAGGTGSDHYGLLPPGRAGDWPEGSYLFTFTDNYTWYGMSEIARCFQHAGLSEASRLAMEADEYKKCILDVMRHEEMIDPETGQLFVPNAVGFKKGYRASWWMADGPIQMFRTGLLEPTDKRFVSTYEITKKKHGVLLGMHETYGHPEWYNNQTDHTFYRCYLARDEFEKALLTYYSSLVYGLSHDCFQTQERTTVYDPNAGTYHINASNIGRILDMMKTMLVDEQEQRRLWLLRGCPRRWFSPGQSIRVQNAPSIYGMLNMSAKSNETGEITVDVSVANNGLELPSKVLVRIPHPTRQLMQRVTVNGKEWTNFDSNKEVVEISPTTSQLSITANY